MAEPLRGSVRHVRVLGGAGVVAGLFVGSGVVASLWHPDTPIWYFWAPLALVLATSAGIAPAIGFGAILGLENLRSLRVERLVTATIGVVVITLIVVNLPLLFPGSGSIAQNSILISWTVIAGSPMALALLGIRQVILGAKDERRGTSD